jgi:endonuclease/exonuclease/phosphatase family metal-dependent hydrolase
MRHVLPVVLLSFVLGCTADEGSEPCNQGAPLRLATFNTGFAEGDIANVGERVQPVAVALNELADVICLQETWLDWDAVQTTMTNLTNVVHLPALENCPAPSCSVVEMLSLQTCGEAMCAGLCGEELLQCGLDHCPDEVEVLGGGCLGCVVQNASACLQGVVDACTSSDPSLDETYLYGCHYDTAILTSLDVVEQRSFVLESYLVTAAVDYARVSTSLGDVDVYCTHYASDIPQITYQGAYDSWEDEQAGQVAETIALIDDNSDGSRPVVLMGDLNCGPGEIEASYARLLADGFTNPYDGNCTLCPSNSFRSDGSTPLLVDHILFKGMPAGQHVALAMTDTISIDVAGDSVETNYSDHYGLVAEVTGPSCR